MVDVAEVGVDREEAAGDSTDWVGLALAEVCSGCRRSERLSVEETAFADFSTRSPARISSLAFSGSSPADA